MAPKKKEYKNCSHCGAKNATGTDDEGFKVIVTRKTCMLWISCPCGIITRLCGNADILKAIWNSRPGKTVKAPELTVKHPVTTKIDPDLLSVGDNKTPEVDAF